MVIDYLPPLYISYPSPIYFATGSLYLLIFLIYLFPSLTLSSAFRGHLQYTSPSAYK